jgi:4'-phosphopantetheinyl transferase EntD
MGYVGSISHSDHLCGAIVAQSGVYAGLGLDIESATPVPADLRDTICRREEQFCRSVPGYDLAKLLFVAKEAVFKAYYPITGIFLDFHDIVVEVDAAKTSFEAVLIGREKQHTPANCPLVGRFGAVDAHIVAVVTIARAAIDDNGSETRRCAT